MSEVKDHTLSRDRALKKRLEELEFLIASSRMLNSTLNFDRLLRVIMRIVKNAIDVEAVSILFLDAQSKQLVFELARGRRDDSVRGLRIPLSRGVVGWVASKGKPLIVNDTKKDGRFSLELEKRLGLKAHSIICIPLKRGGKVVGVIEGINRRGGELFTGDDLSILLALGDHICAAMENARLYREAKRTSLESRVFAQMSAELAKSLSLDEMLKRILTILKKLIDYDAAGIFVFDRREQVLVSELHLGYGGDMYEEIKLKLDQGLVGWAARHRKAIVVGDCLSDRRYVSARRETRSEMVAPMLSREKVIGLFNLESDERDAYTENDLKLLKTFAAHAAVSIERAGLYEEQQKKLELQRELRVARTVQEFFTPKRSRRIGDFTIAGANYPSLTVSGDYYDFFPLEPPHVAFAIADVAGKGVPASIIMSGFRSSLHTTAPYHTSARQIAMRSNEILLETVRPQDFVTAFIGVLNPITGEITYCNAGHNPPILMDKTGHYRFLETGGSVLGVFEEIQLQEGRLRIADETLVCFTDGVIDARNQRGDAFGEKRMIRSIREIQEFSSGRICRGLFRSLKEHVGDTPLFDDVTFLVLKRTPASLHHRRQHQENIPS